MATVSEVISLARRYRGIKESPAGSNHQQFGAWYGLDQQPWCAMFVSFVLYACGFRFKGAQTAKGWSYCPSIAAYFHRRGKLGTVPRVGAIALFHNGTRFYHAEIVTKVNADNSFMSVGGNTKGDYASPGELSNGGQVAEHKHPKSAMTRFAYVDYDAETVHPAPKATTRAKRVWHRLLGVTSPFTRGEDVLAAQRFLIRKGYLAPKNRKGRRNDDSVYGPDTAAATKFFEKSFGGKQDGVFGPVCAAHAGL